MPDTTEHSQPVKQAAPTKKKKRKPAAKAAAKSATIQDDGKVIKKFAIGFMDLMKIWWSRSKPFRVGVIVLLIVVFLFFLILFVIWRVHQKTNDEVEAYKQQHEQQQVQDKKVMDSLVHVSDSLTKISQHNQAIIDSAIARFNRNEAKYEKKN